ncbi:2-oxoglutarate (2OG) and Fe(II)-dependent oxygenase superfamily protein [Carex rostrata]
MPPLQFQLKAIHLCPTTQTHLSSRRCSPYRISCRSMASPPSPPTVRTVSIPFTHLKDRDKDLSGKIEEGFGPQGLGIISVSDVPDFALLRKNLLYLAPRLANLSEDAKRELEDPDSRYNFGWSHGKEIIESGKPDVFKGSFYANPIIDTPTTDTALLHQYPSFCRSNIWPTSSLPELEVAFKALGKLIFEVGLLLAHHCDQYVMQQGSTSKTQGLEETLRCSRCHKGRLLYYFPRPLSECREVTGSTSSWCGWHTDFGSLTGLTCGLFMRNSEEVPCPDSSAGLYVQTRNNKIVKVIYGEDELAYQIGETTEMLYSGLLCATPHCVKAPSGENASGIERCTLAMFMQPNWDERLKLPEKITRHQEFIQPNQALTFGEYTEILNDKYYQRRR